MQDGAASSLLGRIGRASAVAGLIALAILALLSGADRQSRDFPNAPSLSGWPYDTGNARAKAILSFVQTGPESAIAYARRAILSDPLSVQAVSILGRSQLYAGQPDQARQTFQVAGQLGWRDPMTQIYWLDQALQEGDYTVATQRLDALLRQSPDDENRDKFLALVSQTPEGREALAERLKLAPDWAKFYLANVSQLRPDEVAQRVDLVRRTGRGVWDCRATEAITQKLIEAQQFDEAQSVWRLNCATSRSLVYDGGFDQLDTTKQTAGFDWRLPTRGDIDIQLIKGAADNRLLNLSVSAASTMPVLRQLVVLKPGTYRLTWHMPETPDNQARALQVSLTCNADLGRAQPGEPDAGKREYRKLDFTIDSECPARQLVFWLAPRAQVQLDDISLTAAE